jgi:hypothetical protein
LGMWDQAWEDWGTCQTQEMKWVGQTKG